LSSRPNFSLAVAWRTIHRTDAIALKVKQEFTAKAKAKKETKPVPKAKKAA
jgi:hypothetical protein